MTFSEKLTFLMDVVAVKNVDLSRALHIDPSQISRLRAGVRQSPRKPELIESMATFFARRCGADYQRSALAETIGNSYAETVASVSALENIICEWLLNNNEADRPSRAPDSVSVASPTLDGQREPAGDGAMLVYYSNEGKRQAMLELLDRVERFKSPCSILVSSDESNDWLVEDAEFFKRVSQRLLALAKSGVQIQRIIPPVPDINAAGDMFALWLPLYITCNVRSYHLSKLRDGVYHRTLIVVPGLAALVANCVGAQRDGGMTCLFDDKTMIAAFEREFLQFRALCKPALEIYDPTVQADMLSRRMGEFYASHNASIRKSNTLSFATIPRDKKIFFMDNSKSALMRLLCRHVTSEVMPDEKTFFSRPITDIMRLATREEVCAGEVNYYIEDEKYTVDEYKKHLRGIAKLLDKHPSYNVVLDDRYPLDCVVYAKQRVGALLLMTRAPYYVIDITAPTTLQALWDYLERISETGLSPEANRRRVREKLNGLIARLE